MLSLYSDKYISLKIHDNDNGKRLDSILIKFLNIPKSKIIKHIRIGDIKLNKLRPQFSSRVCKGDTICLYKSLVKYFNSRVEKSIIRNNFDFKCITQKLVYEDKDLLVIDKKKGLLVHEGKDSLDVIVNAYLANENLRSLSFKPSAVHRLDRNTSGLLVFAKNIDAARKLSTAFKNRSVIKKYFAILCGEIKSPIVYKNCLYRDKYLKKTFVAKNKNSINAITKIRPILISQKATLVEIVTKTGYTHQIRAQCAFNNHALLGDKKYQDKFQQSNYFLHAFLMQFEEKLFLKNEFYINPSLEFSNKINNIFGNYVLTKSLE